MLRTALLVLTVPLLVAGSIVQPVHVVAWAPGFPGSTTQAQPTMDRFAAALAAASGWDVERITAEYQESEAGGLSRLRQSDTQVALVPLALFFKYEQELGLEPLAQFVSAQGDATESWCLVAPAGRIRSAESLAGWTVLGIPAYSEPFVRGSLLGTWGPLPGDVNVEFTRRVLGGIRRASRGENVAVLLDDSQAKALSALPNADTLEIVARSERVLMGLVVSVGDRLPTATRAALQTGLLRLHDDGALDDTLSTVRVAGFGPVDEAALAASREAFDGAR